MSQSTGNVRIPGEIERLQSLISFPDRGPGGDSRWRGNCSGHIQRAMINHYAPKLFVDVCEGSGTSRDVCREKGIDYVGLDLHKGNDFTRDFVRSQLDRPADICFSHPPYHAMIDYGHVGTFEQPELIAHDTSRCQSVDEFLEKSYVMLLNQREATRPRGVYATLIGDMRKKGVFRSFQADFLGMMPTSEQLGVVIKGQFNCVSDSRQYSGDFIPIQHEYLLLWRRADRTMVHIALDQAVALRQRTDWTWRALLRMVFMRHFTNRAATLAEIYSCIEQEAPEMLRDRPNWNAKVRQILQRHFAPVSRGLWAADADACRAAA